MSNRYKNIIYSVLLIGAAFMVWKYRQTKSGPVVFRGETMGTTYHIIYFEEEHRDFQNGVDSLLGVFNLSMSTYIENSEVNRFNENPIGIKYQLPFFYPVLKKSREIVSSSLGAYDPTVMPLVNAWGFGPDEEISLDSNKVKLIREYVGFEKIIFNSDSVWKTDPRVQLDFSAIAKGYAADLVAEYLMTQGINNLFVEIGGEVVAKGMNQSKGHAWHVGILDPDMQLHPHEFKAHTQLSNRAMATSGNYFNYREIEGKKYSHTIDPISGYPSDHAILSATVFANDCMTADAWATAFMIMGHEKGIEVATAHPEIDVLFVFSLGQDKEGTYVSPRVDSQIIITSE